MLDLMCAKMQGLGPSFFCLFSVYSGVRAEFLLPLLCVLFALWTCHSSRQGQGAVWPFDFRFTPLDMLDNGISADTAQAEAWDVLVALDLFSCSSIIAVGRMCPNQRAGWEGSGVKGRLGSAWSLESSPAMLTLAQLTSSWSAEINTKHTLFQAAAFETLCYPASLADINHPVLYWAPSCWFRQFSCLIVNHMRQAFGQGLRPRVRAVGDVQGRADTKL